MSHPATDALEAAKPSLGVNVDKATQFAQAAAHPDNELLDVDEKSATLTFPSGTLHFRYDRVKYLGDGLSAAA
jgi:hypothetical protein